MISLLQNPVGEREGREGGRRTCTVSEPEARPCHTTRSLVRTLPFATFALLIFMFLGGTATAGGLAGVFGPPPCAPLLAQALPDPKSAEAVGWMVGTAAGLVVIAGGFIGCMVGIKALRAKPAAVPAMPQPFMTEQTKIYVQEPHFRAELSRVESEMNGLKTDMHHQLKEFRAYVHTEMHEQTNQNQVLLTAMNLQKQELTEALGEVHDRVTGVLQTVTETKALREANGARLLEISAETTDNGKQIAKLSGLVEQALKKGLRA